MKALGVLVGGLLVLIAGLGGFVGLAESQAHGDSILPALALLTVGLIGLAWLVVRIMSALMPAWRDGAHPGQKTLVGLLIVVLAGGGAVAYVQHNVVSQRPAAEVTATLAPACVGVAVPTAGLVDNSGARLNHLVVLDQGGREHAWTGYPPVAWRPPTVEDAEYVACVTNEETRTVIETCNYMNGSPITRYRASRDVSLVEARTGVVVLSYIASDDARECHQTEDKSLTELSGAVSWGRIEADLVAYVDPGGIATEPSPGQDVRPTVRPSPTTAAVPTAGPPSVLLSDAIDQSLIEATLSGDGLQHLSIDTESLSTDDLTVTIPAGTYFDPRRDGTQSMVALIDQEFGLAAGESATWEVDVACAEMRRDQPTDSDRMTIRQGSATGDLADLLALPAFADQSFRVQQFAVWTLTNNPTRNNYMGLGTAFSVYGSGPDKEEFAAIRDLFEQAGINPRDYRAFR